MHNWLEDLPASGDAQRIAVVDGGGTKSRALVARTDGELLAYAENGPTNARSAGDGPALEHLEQVVAEVQEQAGGPVDLLMVMSAAVDTEAHAGAVREALERVTPRAAVAVIPDTAGPWALANDLGPAVIAIAGTGSAVLAASLEPPVFRRYGGWDFVLGDEGSGFTVGREVVRQTLLFSEGRGEARAMAEACLAELGLDDADAIMDRLHKPVLDKSVIASLASVAFARIEAGDPIAERIIRDQVALLVDTVVVASAGLDAPGHPIALFGGLFDADAYRDEFERQWAATSQAEHPLRRPDGAALAGGFALALHCCGTAPAEARPATERLGRELAAR